MPRPNFDWFEEYGKKHVKRFASIPYLMAAGSLLRGAGLLWQGRRGMGRLRKAEIDTFAGTLYDQAYHLRRAAFGWSREVLPDTTGDIASACTHLASATVRHSYEQSTEKPDKSPRSARLLFGAAMDLLEEALARSPEHIPKLEDAMEEQSERPYGEPLEMEIPLEALKELLRYGICLEAADVAMTTAYALAVKGDYDDKKRSELKAPWWALASSCSQSASLRYLSFASRIEFGELRPTLLCVGDKGNCHPNSWRTFSNKEEDALIELVSSAFLSVLVVMSEELTGWTPDFAAEIPVTKMRPTLPKTTKKLPK